MKPVFSCLVGELVLKADHDPTSLALSRWVIVGQLGTAQMGIVGLAWELQPEFAFQLLKPQMSRLLATPASLDRRQRFVFGLRQWFKIPRFVFAGISFLLDFGWFPALRQAGWPGWPPGW